MYVILYIYTGVYVYVCARERETEDNVVGHARLGQEDIQLPGHAAGDRVDPEPHLHEGQKCKDRMGTNPKRPIAGCPSSGEGVKIGLQEVLARSQGHTIGRVSLLATKREDNVGGPGMRPPTGWVPNRTCMTSRDYVCAMNNNTTVFS